ncbi:ankyrin repeat-containing protein ITN1-like [Abrus precatorius]|uniref:Ankyrin repeat-containing protein ITN1-like n=1 Tax=Abrus precatorius TaxID=3816 RepID=A0A8B8JDS8_ABRPR|nr:ankyrin repeat-containing protein ITN1-like [Abrus precatorius]
MLLLSPLLSQNMIIKLMRLGKKDAKPNKKFWRSNSLPLSREFPSVSEYEDPSVKFLDDTNIQIIISSNEHIHSLSHEQTPIEAASAAASPQDENRRVNEMTPEDLSSLKRQLYVYALHNMWQQAQPIFGTFPDMVRIPLTASGDTALHVAVSANSNTFVQGLVNLMTPEDLRIPNSDGNTAFCMAAISGNGEDFQIMIEKNENLPLIPGHDGLLPVHLAALTGHHKIVQFLSSQNLLHKMASKDIEWLFFMTISSSMFGMNEGNDNKEASSGTGLELLKKLWSHVRQLEYKKILELITQPSALLFDAVKSGNVEAVKWLLYMNRELLTIKDPSNGRNLLHFTVLYRQSSIFFFILKMTTVNLVLRAVDNDRNNILHLAAHQQDEASSSLRPNIQMQRELVWFKEVEKRVPHELRTMRNNNGKTPNDIFYDNHKKLSKEVKDAAKGIADSGMLVTTLIATVAFAAALTVPGDKTNAWFIVFILTNAVALFSSSASIISFLSIFTTSKLDSWAYLTFYIHCHYGPSFCCSIFFDI